MSVVDLKLEILETLPGMRILWTDGARSLAARGNRLLVRDQGGRYKAVAYLGSSWERALGASRVARHALRLGIHHFLPLLDGGYLVSLRKRAYALGTDGVVRSAFRFPRGNKPASKGICVAPNGEVFVAEYALNGDRSLPAVLHRSRDGGKTFQPVHAFAPGAVRHYHFVQWDDFEECLWAGTGDADGECRLLKSTDGGDRWIEVGGGSQLWRAVGVGFRADALYWGTDAGSDAGNHPNFVMRLDRRTGRLEKVLELQGPCHGNATLRDGTLVISTGVEGGVNEKDGRAHLWVSRDGRGWTEVSSWAKDRWPYVVQFGVIRFPHGLERADRLVFTCMGLRGAAETTFVASL